MSVLGKEEILARAQPRLFHPGEIFLRDTWDEERLRGAAYDLRISGTYLITPDGTRYWPEGERLKERKGSFKLNPKEVAFVSTVEHLRMPCDLAGNIAPRFRRTLEGILVMGGMLVDPGYEGQLHFQLVNIGAESFTVVPGETSVAALQFLPVKRATTKLERIPSSKGLLEQLFYEGADERLPQLAFFSNVRALEGDLADLERRVDDQQIKLDSTKRSTDQLLVFGVFLVSITLFTVAIAAIIDALAGNSLDDAISTASGAELTVPGLVVAGVLLVVVAIACYFMMRPVAKITAALGKSTSVQTGPPEDVHR
jgi:deoxycytidine triphosphate deaminase